MMPTEEERQKIEEAQLANPDVPLGPAENFLMTLASIGGLAARLQLWAFKLDYTAAPSMMGVTVQALYPPPWFRGKGKGESQVFRAG